MSDYMNSLRNLFEAYKKWVSENPQTVSDVETTSKWVSYFVAGRISNSSIVSELIYSLSNILVLFNDRIIEKANAGPSLTEGIKYRLKLMLTTLEYCEVLIEISARKLWGKRGRWFFIIAVQVVKTIGRYLLMKQYSEDIIRNPPIPVLDRKKLQEQPSSCTQDNGVYLNDTFSFKLKRSGRIMRKVEGAPPIHMRDWKPIQIEDNNSKNSITIPTAESLYIAKPLIHLGAVGIFGYKNWKSYSIALLLDLASIRMYYNNRHLLSKEQKVELSRRCVNLLLYLLRSPFYEKSTKKRLEGFLRALANNIPLVGAVCNPLIQYIPQFQDTYFYMWSI